MAPRGFHGTAVSARRECFRADHDPERRPGLLGIPNHDGRDFYWVHLFARLKPGVTREAAAAAINPLYSAILSEVEAPLLIGVAEQERDAFRTRAARARARRARANRVATYSSRPRNSLELLLAVSGVVLLLGCANVAGLVLLRATTRSGEMAVRASMGATRVRIASLQLAESLVLALPAAL